MASPRPKPIKKIPTYVLAPGYGYDARECELVNSRYAQELDSLFAVDQMVQRREALRYAEQELRKKNLKLFTQDELYQFIVELHRISAHSLVLLNNQVHSGTFANFRVSMRRETGIPGVQFDTKPDFSQHNYNILKQKHDIKVAESYKEFCRALADAIKKNKNQRTLSNLIFESELDQHPGFEAFSLINRFGEKPENMDKTMQEFCQILRAKLQSKSADPLDCAAYALFRLCQIHPFSNGNGTVARILMNCVLMDFGINPIQIGPDNKSEYYHAIENARLEDLNLLKKFIRKNLNTRYSEEEAEPMFPDDRGVTFVVNWDPSGHDVCRIYSECYEVVASENFNNYDKACYAAKAESKAPLFLKMMAPALKATLVKLKIDETYCEEKGEVHEAAGNFQVAVYYFKRAADFCLVARKKEQAKRLSDRSEKLRLQLIQVDSLAERKISIEQKSAAPLSSPHKTLQSVSIDALPWQELKAIVEKKKKAKNAADNARIRERLVDVIPKLKFDKSAIESVGLSLHQLRDFLNSNEVHCVHIANYSDLIRKIADTIADEKKAIAERKDAALRMDSKLYSIADVSIAVPTPGEDKKIDRSAVLNAGAHPASLFVKV